MPLPQNFNVLFGAGVFGIVCAATLYALEHYRQDRRRHKMAKDLARLDTELSVLRQELNVLLSQQNKRLPKKTKRNFRLDSVVSSSSTAEEYMSAVEVDGDSSDLEFYDVSDDEVDALTVDDKELDKIDKTLEEGDVSQLESCLQRLVNFSLEFPDNPHLLWRLGKAHYRLYLKTEDRQHINRGIEACRRALSLKPELSSVHKWLAILVGERSQYQPMKEKILDGFLFKEHIDAAVRLDPRDATLHYMLGRFAYDVAELKWYERKVATALFAEPPTATVEEALVHFLEAEKLSDVPLKDNLLYIAKCKLKMGDVEEAVTCLEKADAIDQHVDSVIDKEVTDLLNKYKK